jgi:hypothetical protein
MSDDAVTIARLTNLHLEDEAAHDALRQAARDAGEPKPQGLLDSLAANHLEAQGQLWAATPAGQERLRHAKAELAAQGAAAYVEGRSGNAYTQHLVKRFGASSAARNAGTSQRAPAGDGNFAGLAQAIGDSWAWYRRQHAVVQGTIATIYAGMLLLAFYNNRNNEIGVFDVIVLVLGAVLFTGIVSFLVAAIFGLGLVVRRLVNDPEMHKASAISTLKTAGTLAAVGAGLGLVWWAIAKASSNQPVPSPLVHALGVAGMVLIFPGVFTAGALCGETLNFFKPSPLPDTAVAASSAVTAPVFNQSPAESPPALASPSQNVPELIPKTLAWTDGCLVGDRMGAKRFETVISTELSPLDVMVQISRLMTQLHFVQPWRVNGQVRTLSDIGVSITAASSYQWDNSPYYSEENGKIVLIQSVTGQTKSGNGTLHLECAVTGDESNCRVTIAIEFTEPAYPMWLKRQAEATVALTLVDLGKEMAIALNDDITWKFVSGDWTVFQLIPTPIGSLTIRRARGG